MAVRYKKKIKKRLSVINRSELKYCLFITLACLVMGFVLAFITGNVPSFLDRIIQKQTDRIAAENVKSIGADVLEGKDQKDIEDMVKRYRNQTRN